MNLNRIQTEIQKALVKLGERSRFSEAVLAKKIREEIGIDGKKKAGIALLDLEKAAEFLEESEGFHYSFMLNSANDLLIEKTCESRFLEGESRSRRLKSERAMSLFTDGDIEKSTSKKSLHSKKSKNLRTERKSIQLQSDFEDFE
ncbi:hypothetical protein [Treponema zioleckii]|uniref:hypothetical protein n=1 Tax=Treponema zioleckii TaxID=331680 RepID=UPI00168AE870|nr:hypothetical protein [Treponema zioleckii]